MENASKALIIAGGVLIAIIILSMFLVMYNRIANIKKTEQEQLKLEQLLAFNAEFEAYDKKIMYGVDVITLINKVSENNKTYFGYADYQISIKLNGTEIYESSSLIGTNFEKNIFECTKMDYNNSGRVCKIEIQIKS